MSNQTFQDFIDHNAPLLDARWQNANDGGDGEGWGCEDDTPRTAAARHSAAVLHEDTDGTVLATLGGRLYMICDAGGPWACQVATQEDLGL